MPCSSSSTRRLSVALTWIRSRTLSSQVTATTSPCLPETTDNRILTFSLFAADGSTYGLGVEGLNQALLDYFGDEIEELFAENYFEEEPRRLDEIVEAERQLFDRIWYHRSLQHEYRLEDAGDDAGIEHLLEIAGPGRQRVEELYAEPGQLGPYTDFELGMLNGKLSALRWVLGSEWDFLDT